MAEEVKEEKKEKKESKNKVKDVSYVSLIVCVLIMVLGVFALGVYAGFRYSKGNQDKCAVEDKLEDKKEEKKEDKKEEKNDNTVVDNTKKCSGYFDAVYHGTYHEEGGVFTLDEDLTLTLKKDGSFSQVVVNSEGSGGKYEIKDGNIYLSYCPIYGPCDDYTVETYKISDDCSKITINDNYILNKKSN
jgi:hypothetical protein